MRVGYIGLGNMGRAQAEHLLEQDVQLLVWNRTAARAEGLDAQVAATPAEVVSACDVTFLCLFDSHAVEDVMYAEEGGLLAAELEGKVIIDCTTNHYEPVVEFHEEFAEAGAHYVEAPVIGSVVPARQGRLLALVAGEQAGIEAAHPYLSLIASKVVELKEPGLPTKMKLINNMVLASFMATIAEATALGEAVGLEREQILDILEAGAGNSGVLAAKKEKLLEDDFTAHFSIGAMFKDLGYLDDLAESLPRPLYMAAPAKQLFAEAAARMMGDEDLSAVYRVLTGC